jgi:hypothetical protein
MYKIRGQDEKTFGPYTADVVRQWIAAGRAGPETLVCKVGESTWKPLSEFPEFQGAPGLLAQALTTPASESKAPSHAITPQTSVLATTSLILGLLGLLGLTALAGLVTGIIALKSIARSGGRLRGTGLAMAGTVLSGSMLLLSIPMLAGVLVVPMLKARQEKAEIRCLENIRELNQAIHTYAASHQGRFPSAQSWSDQLVQANLLVSGAHSFQCPSRPGNLCSYAFNEHLSELSSTNVPPNTVVLFESERGWNGHGSSEDMASSRHGMYLIVGFADGTVERVPAWQFPQLRWLP